MNSCSLCDEISAECLDISKEVTIFTQRPISELISLITTSTETISTLDLICHPCMLKVNKFDEFSARAAQVQKEIQEIIQRKVKIKLEPAEIAENARDILEWCNVKQEDYISDYQAEEDEINSESEEFPSNFVSSELHLISKSKSSKRGRPPKQKHSSGFEILYCSEPGCDRRFNSRAKLNFHFQYHSKERPFVCDSCGKAFKTKSCLCSHRRSVHKEKRVICNTCGLDFSRKQGLLRHFQSAHLNMRPFVCATCGLSYNNSSSLKSHQFTHNPEHKPVVCEICSARFYNKSKLDRHMRSHSEKEYPCHICQRMFSQRYNVTAHLKTVHGIGAQELKESAAKPILCQLCGRIFDKQKSLQAHLRSVHEAVPLTESF